MKTSKILVGVACLALVILAGAVCSDDILWVDGFLLCYPEGISIG
jgi:hypothetical protein